MHIKPALWIFKCEHGKTCNFIADCNICAKAEITRLTAEVAELRKDAERYRWLRCAKISESEFEIIVDNGSDGLDERIDAAIKSEQKERE